MDATSASDLDLDRGVLPGQQAVVRCRNSVKAMRLNACDVVTRLTSEKASTRMGERGCAAHGVSARRKC